MSNIPTAEEFMTDEYQIKHYGTVLTKPTQAAIEFAKLHVQAQNKAIIENVEIIDYDEHEQYSPHVDEQTILTAYPLTNIK